MPRKPLTADERDCIHEHLSADRSVPYAEVPRALGPHRSTISRGVTRNGGRHAYRPSAAGDAVATRRHRPKALLLAAGSPLRERVIELISKGLLTGRHSRPVCPSERRWHGERRDDLPVNLRRHAWPQGDRVPPLQPGATEAARGVNIVYGVAAGAERGPDQQTPSRGSRGRAGPLGGRHDHRSPEPVRRVDAGGTIDRLAARLRVAERLSSRAGDRHPGPLGQVDTRSDVSVVDVGSRLGDGPLGGAHRRVGATRDPL